MSVIPSSQLVLSRNRRDLSKAMAKGDWSEVSILDKQLAEALEVASTDEGRDLGALLSELGHLLGLYKDLMKTCDENTRRIASASAPK